MVKSKHRNINVAVLVVIAVLAPLCRAIHFTNPNWDARPGEILHLTWTDQVKWATITLMSGQPEASVKEGNDVVISYSQELELQWRVPDDKPEGDYFLLIHDLSGNTNYSPVFRLASAAQRTVIASVPFATSVAFFTLSTGTLSAATGATATPTDSLSQPTGSNNLTQPEVPQTSSDLSTGTKAGIAVGATIGIMALLGGMSFFFYHRGKAIGASRRDDDHLSPGGWRHPWKRRRLQSRDGSDLEDGGVGKFRSPTPTPQELSGEDKLPSELGSDVGPAEIGTDWPAVAELSAGELCMEEMEQECGEIKLSPLTVSESGSEYRAGEKPVVSPLTPVPPDKNSDHKESEKYLRRTTDGAGQGHDRQDTKPLEIQIQLKEATGSPPRDKKG
ncbi:hypothetical protein V8F06_009718 [Rhypophila decipiens]